MGSGCESRNHQDWDIMLSIMYRGWNLLLCWNVKMFRSAWNQSVTPTVTVGPHLWNPLLKMFLMRRPDGTKYLKHNLKQENTSCLGAVQKIPEEMWRQSLLQIKVRWAQGVPLFLHWRANDQTLEQLLFKRFCPTTSEWQLCSHLVQQLVVRHQKAFSRRTKCPQRGKHF